MCLILLPILLFLLELTYMTELDERTRSEEQEAGSEQEFRARMDINSREEEYARREPELRLLMYPDSPKDIDKAICRILDRYTDFDKSEMNSPYKLQYVMETVAANVFIFGHSPQDLEDEEYINGTIGEDGFLEENGEVKKFGYAIRVEKVREEKTIKEQKEKRHEAWTENTVQVHKVPVYNQDGSFKEFNVVEVEVEIRHPERVEKWEEVSRPTLTIEKFYYGTKNERKALENASDAALERSINTARQHGLFEIMEGMRADISGLVTTYYLKAKHISNDQLYQVFNSPDISKIDSENLENKENGTKIDRAMRMMDLLGHAETKEKMEDFINKPTFSKIIEYLREEGKALDVMKFSGFEDNEKMLTQMIRDEFGNIPEEQKNKLVKEYKIARFLIGKGAIRRDGKWVLEGEISYIEDGENKTEKWMTKDERDPSIFFQEWKDSKNPDKKVKWKRGFAAKKFEERVRGYLTEFGNVYAQKHTDILIGRIKSLIGDASAVRDADRYFQIFGQRDELNLEVLTDNLPSAEEIIAKHRIKGEKGYDKWREYADFWMEYFKLQGDPVASDLSKIFYPQFYRLKDILRDRPAGPILTVHDFKRFAQSMFSLGRSEIKINGEIQIRSILEQWRGYAQIGKEGKDGYMPAEKAKDLGEFEWSTVQVPENVMQTASDLMGELMADRDQVLENLEQQAIPDEIKEDIKAMLKEVDEAVTPSIYTYYSLMNWLAGRDSKIKAPWLFILDEEENFRVLENMNTWTNKEKFLSIVLHGPAQAWGNWRDLHIQHGNKDAVNAYLNDLEYNSTQEGKRNWYKGARNIPGFSKVMAQRVHIVRPDSDGYYKDEEVGLYEIVEGSTAEPGLAALFGFLEAGEISSTIEHRKEDRKQRLIN